MILSKKVMGLDLCESAISLWGTGWRARVETGRPLEATAAVGAKARGGGVQGGGELEIEFEGGLDGTCPGILLQVHQDSICTFPCHATHPPCSRCSH